jgi:hypothetical protein
VPQEGNEWLNDGVGDTALRSLSTNTVKC